MASTVAIKQFEKLQAGREATKGTSVASKWVMVGNGIVKEMQERYFSGYPRGVAATVGGDGVLTKKWTEWELESELTPQELLMPCLMGLKGNVTATGAGADKTWLFSRTLTAEPTLDSFTLEFVENDGTTNQIQTECYYNMLSSMALEWTAESAAKLKCKGFGRARQAVTPTAALTPFVNRDIAIMTGQLTTVYFDTTWAGLGGTQLAGIVRSATLDINTGLKPDFTMDGRTDQDPVSHQYGALGGKLAMTIELNASAATRFANWRAGTREFIRIKTIGPVLGSTNYGVIADLSCRYSGPPQFSQSNDGMLMSCAFDLVYDVTGTKILELSSVCDITAVASL